MIIKSYELNRKKENFSKYNLFLLYGENVGLKKDISDIIKSGVTKNNEKVEYLSLYEKDLITDEESFYNSIYSGSLFSKKKIITINEATDKLTNQFENIVSKYPENVFLIILANLLEKKSKLRNFFEKNKKTLCIACYADEFKDLEAIAIMEFKKNNISLSRESLNLLIEKSNSDRNNLKNEIEKIKSYSLSKKKLEFDEIKSIVNFSGEYKSEDLVNECLCGNTLGYKKILSELYMSTINQIFLLRILSNKIQRLFNMKKHEKNYDNLDGLLNSSKPPIFWKEKNIVKKQLHIWKLKDLKKIINEINNTELLCKKYPQLSKIILFNFLTKLCSKASTYS